MARTPDRRIGRTSARRKDALSETDYETLAEFRYALRQFLNRSAAAARSASLTPQQHQALLAIRGHAGGAISIGGLAEKLMREAPQRRGTGRATTSSGSGRAASRSCRSTTSLCIPVTSGAGPIGDSVNHSSTRAASDPTLAAAPVREAGGRLTSGTTADGSAVSRTQRPICRRRGRATQGARETFRHPAPLHDTGETTKRKSRRRCNGAIFGRCGDPQPTRAASDPVLA